MFEKKQLFGLVYHQDGSRTIYKVFELIHLIISISRLCMLIIYPIILIVIFKIY